MNKPKNYDKTFTLRLTTDEYERLNKKLLEYINSNGNVLSMTEFIKLKLEITDR